MRFVQGSYGLCVACGLLFAFCCRSLAQAPTVAATVEDALHQMEARAGVIFTGQVVAVRPLGSNALSPAVVEIDFRVENAIRGCTAGSTYTLREWGGLWAADGARYQPGERLLMLLHAPTAAGLSSPVDGQDGAIPIVGATSQVASASSVAAIGAVAATESVDLRWLAAKVLRPLQYAPPQLHRGVHPLAAGGLAVAADGARASSRESSSSVAMVVAMLRQWEAADAAR
ncbi:MAG: hypothetical protein KGK08_01995 [Acidobacteriota bacterium]|nr:hypothetical protein [Acidobacteriota bacterium]